MSTKRIGRREALKRVGALAAVPLVAGYHPLVPIQEGRAWQPRFFDAREAELVAELAEHIIPETDTPGARGAHVHQFIDLVLSQASPEEQQSFRNGLTRFAGAGAERQVELLSEGGPFFERLKELTIDGYYESSVGMQQELGFEGRRFVTVFDGCTHDEHLRWTPKED